MRITKKHLFLILALLYFTPSFGQKKEASIKLSASLLRTGAADNPDFIETDMDEGLSAILAASFVLKNEKKSRYQELGITRIASDSDTRGNIIIDQNIIAGRYEYGWLGKQFNEYLSMRYGGMVEIYFSKNDANRTTTQGFPRYQKHRGALVGAAGHFDLSISDRLYFDFNPAIILFSTAIEKTESLNPTLPQRAQNQNTFSLDGGGFLLQFGVGYKL